MSAIGITSEQLGRFFIVAIGAAWLVFRIRAGDNLNLMMFGPTITILVPLMLFVIYWLAEGIVILTNQVETLKRLQRETQPMISSLTTCLDKLQEQLPPSLRVDPTPPMVTQH
jgi:hypothetical protein